MLPAIALYAGITAKVVQKPLNHRGEPQWRGLSVAELAKSSGFPAKSQEVYATTPIKFPLSPRHWG